MPADDVADPAETGNSSDPASTDDGVNGEDSSADSALLTELKNVDTIRWAEGVVTGAVTYVVGYLVTAALFFIGPGSLQDNLSISEQLARIGVFFNGAHFINVNASDPVIVITTEGTTDLGSQFGLFRYADLLNTGFGISENVLLAVPVLVLLSVGAGRAWRLSRTATPTVTVSTSLAMTLGYGAVAYLGTMLFSYPLGEATTVDGTAVVATTGYQITGGEIGTTVLTFSSDAGDAILTGLGYPLACATAGAAVAVLVRRSFATATEE